MKTGLELIQQERNEQIHKHNRQVKEDVRLNSNGQLSFAAALLCAPDPKKIMLDPSQCLPEGWNLTIWSKMIYKPWKERLIIAGALIAAEIDRINAISK